MSTADELKNTWWDVLRQTDLTPWTKAYQDTVDAKDGAWVDLPGTPKSEEPKPLLSLVRTQSETNRAADSIREALHAARGTKPHKPATPDELAMRLECLRLAAQTAPRASVQTVLEAASRFAKFMTTGT